MVAGGRGDGAGLLRSSRPLEQPDGRPATVKRCLEIGAAGQEGRSPSIVWRPIVLPALRRHREPHSRVHRSTGLSKFATGFYPHSQPEVARFSEGSAGKPAVVTSARPPWHDGPSPSKARGAATARRSGSSKPGRAADEGWPRAPGGPRDWSDRWTTRGGIAGTIRATSPSLGSFCPFRGLESRFKGEEQRFQAGMTRHGMIGCAVEDDRVHLESGVLGPIRCRRAGGRPQASGDQQRQAHLRQPPDRPDRDPLRLLRATPPELVLPLVGDLLAPALRPAADVLPRLPHPRVDEILLEGIGGGELGGPLFQAALE
jgi:hypothetical protein